MSEDWKGALTNLDLPVKGIEEVWRNWNGETKEEKISGLYQTMAGNEPNWPTSIGLIDRLNKRVYSPLQMLMYLQAYNSRRLIWEDYPFLFTAIGRTIDTLMKRVYPDLDVQTNTSSGAPIDGRKVYQRLLQAVFYLRERREEREPLSIEIQLPLDGKAGPIEIKKFAQVFGRGVGVSRSKTLTRLNKPAGSVARIFTTHKNAPQSLLYTLRSPYAHLKDPTPLKEPRLTIVLRRDGHVAIAAYQNPLLEFYDGGWHVCDLQAGEYTLQELLGQRFGGQCNPNLGEVIMRLAYHLGTHWHGGLLAVVEDEAILDDPKGPFERESKESEVVLRQIEEKMKSSKSGKARITDVGDSDEEGAGGDQGGSGKGRLLLSCAIQDGAMVINRDGDILSVGRIVRTHNPQAQSQTSVGSRRHAARTLGNSGLALAISHDGAIRLYLQDDTKGISIRDLRLH